MKYLRPSVMVAAMAAIGIGAWFALPRKHDPFCCAEFDKETWQRGSASESCLRGAMVRPLMREKILPGTPMYEVVGVLGPPERQLDHIPRCARYHLGLCARPGYWGLRVCYDPGNKVSSVEITP